MQDPLNPEVLGADESEGRPADVATALDPITRAEIDMQIATARRFPRDIGQVKKDMIAMVTLDEQVAESCYYTLKRSGGEQGGGLIEGPSIRLAEIALSCFGNVRAATRFLGETEDGRFVRTLGVVHDVQKNFMVAREVTRRITNKHGKRYGDDMVGVTIAAAGAIALRNATFTVIPRSLVKPAYEAAREVALGKTKSLTFRRDEVVGNLRKLSPLVTVERILAAIDKRSLEEITWDDIRTMIGLRNSIRDGQATVEETFPDPAAQPTSVGEILGTAVQNMGGAPPQPFQGEESVELAGRRGKLAKQQGFNRDSCPYPAETLQGMAWLAEWDAEAPLGAESPQDRPKTAPESLAANTGGNPTAEPAGPPQSNQGGGDSLFDEKPPQEEVKPKGKR